MYEFKPLQLRQVDLIVPTGLHAKHRSTVTTLSQFGMSSNHAEITQSLQKNAANIALHCLSIVVNNGGRSSHECYHRQTLVYQHLNSLQPSKGQHPA